MRAINIWRVAKNKFGNYKSNIGGEIATYIDQGAMLHYSLRDFFFFPLEINEIFEEKHWRKFSFVLLHFPGNSHYLPCFRHYKNQALPEYLKSLSNARA